MKTYAIGEAAKLAGVGASTARDYLKAFPDYFADAAVPSAGGRRVLTWDDIETLATIKRLRKHGRGTEEIRASLASGDRDSIQEQAADAGAPGPSTALMVRLTAAAAQWEATATAIVEERDHLREQLDQSQADRMAAEIRAVEAETRLQMIADTAAPKVGFWRRMFGGEE